MNKLVVTIMLVVFANGCHTVPFQETTLVPLSSEQPQSIVERFQANMPVRFQLLNTIVFEYNWRKFSGIGYVDINRQDKTFKVVCLNPMGVKLFELEGDRNSIVTHYAIAALTQYGDLPAAVGNDIRRIYFDMVPSAEAHSWKRKYKINFRQFIGPGYIEHVFAGAGGDLIEKNYYEDNRLVWQVSYYEYRERSGKRYPQGIIFSHYQYGYRLTVRQKEFRS
jgi:hypothetical protein